MKKIALIIVVIIFSLTAKAQHFGVMPELGASWIANSGYDADKRSPGLFYGLGMYYTTKIGESKWGVRTSLAFNKRGYKEVDLINRTSTNSLGTKYFLKEFQSIYYNYATSVIIAPTFQLSDKLIAMIGFHYTYSFGPNSKDIHNYFETDENGDNKVLYNTRKFKYGNNGISFVDNSYYGIKAAIFYQVSGIIDFGLAYQYSRPFKSNSYGSTRFYNIINITTTIYFKTRE